MTNSEKMLRLVLSDVNLSKYYEYDANDYESIQDALNADNPIVVAVAKIIMGIKKGSDASQKRTIYKEVYDYLLKNL